MKENIGKKVIIRGDRSGVEYGELVAQEGQHILWALGMEDDLKI